jgi:hypothetical protein
MSDRAGRGGSQAAPPRRGLFPGMGVPPMDEMPRIRTAVAHGLVRTWSSPVIVGGILAWLLVEWLVVVALGYPGPIALLAHVPAPPPIGTITDYSLATGILGARGLAFIFLVAAVHALWQAVLTGLAVEAIESGGPSRWGAIRGLRAFPVAFAVRVIGLMALIAAQLLLAFGGSSGIGLLAQIAVFVVVTWLLGFAPVIAVTEHRRLLDCLGRSVRAARMPGSGNLTFAALYVIPVFATFFALPVPGVMLDVNPPFTAWMFVVGMNLLHTALLAALAMRYLSIAAKVPEAPPRRAPAREARARPARGTGRGTSRR